MKIIEVVKNKNQEPSLYETQQMINLLDRNGHFKHLDKLLTESTLNETAEYIQSDGRWWVQYANGEEMHEFRSEREARRAADEFNRSGQKTPGSNTSAVDRAAIERRNQELSDAERNRVAQNKARFRSRMVEGLRWLRRFANVAGAASIIMQQVQVQEDLYGNFLLGCYAPRTPGQCDGDPNDPEAQRIYTRLSKASYGLMVTQLTAQIALAMRDARRARRALTAIRAAATGAGMVAGPVGALVGFLIGEAVSYGVLWLLSRPSTIETLISWMFSIDDFLEPLFGDDSASRSMSSVGDFANPQVPLPASVRGDIERAQDIVGANRVPGDIARAQQDRATDARGSTGMPSNTPSQSSGSNLRNRLLDVPN